MSASDPGAVMSALRDALTADGPAVFPVQSGTDAPSDLPATVARRIAVVVQTSGSTGRPKRVALTADALLASAAASDTALGGSGQWLLALPAHYIAGVNVLVRSITAQTEPIVLPAGHFDAGEFARAASALVGDRRYTSVVPTQLARLVEFAETDAAAAEPLRRFDRMLVGGQSTSRDLLARAASLGMRVTRTYGSSETSGGCVYDGVPIGTASMDIVDGEVQLSGPMLAAEYLDDPERTSSSFVLRDGIRWYRTDDMGTVENGRLRVTGRLDRVIISGGEKVSLDEIERVVRSLPEHQDDVAVAVEDARWGQSPVVVSRAGEQGVSDAVVSALGRAARPQRVVTVSDIPLLPSGKPDRLALARLLEG